MASTVKFESRSKEVTDSGITETLTRTGDLTDIEQIANSLKVGSSSASGTLKSYRVFQSGPHWCIETKYETGANGEAVSANPDNYAYGKKSASLKCAMLALPLEKAPEYKTKWNHYLFAAPEYTNIPAFWDQATSTVIPEGYENKYRWGKSEAEVPTVNGVTYRVIADPTKLGQDTFEVPTAVITESYKASSPNSAGKIVAAKIGKLCAPDNTFGLSARARMWKVDDASVSWNGKYWIVTMTFTKAGNDDGWDTDLYEVS